MSAAMKAGAEIDIEPFTDPIGRDAVIQWPGGLKMQLYWRFKASTYAPLQSIPESRVYVSPNRVDELVRDLIKFAHGKVISDDRRADSAAIGRPGATHRRILVRSEFGKTLLLATNGHLPYPFGRETTGYEVSDVRETLSKATATGARVLSDVNEVGDRTTAILEFPGGYIAEIHALRSR